MNVYPESVIPTGEFVISGAWMIPFHALPLAQILSPLSGNERDDPLDETLTIFMEPLPAKVTPVDVEPLR